jgi:hypothetical protein
MRASLLGIRRRRRQILHGTDPKRLGGSGDRSAGEGECAQRERRGEHHASEPAEHDTEGTSHGHSVGVVGLTEG